MGEREPLATIDQRLVKPLLSKRDLARRAQRARSPPKTRPPLALQATKSGPPHSARRRAWAPSARSAIAVCASSVVHAHYWAEQSAEGGRRAGSRRRTAPQPASHLGPRPRTCTRRV